MAGRQRARAPRQPADAGEVASTPSFASSEVSKARKQLLDWYDRNHRVLPWRRTPLSKQQKQPQGAACRPAPAALDGQQFAYLVWVSEIMLQQTQVATVISYFEKWTAKWPTVKALSGATQEEVNHMWAGLGYYRRARYLLDGAAYICNQLGGSFPTTAKDMLQIPGVGPYTAAAIASIAFNDPAAAVDGNVIRVVSRLRALSGDPRKLTRTHQELATQLLSPERPGDYNQAMMELGATVCRPSNPDCGACALAGICTANAGWRAYLEGGGAPDVEDAPRVTRYPAKVEKAAKKQQRLVVVVLEVVAADNGGPDPKPKKAKLSSGSGPGSRRGGGGEEAHTLLVKRPEEGLLAGLWEFPAVMLATDASSDDEDDSSAKAPTAAARQAAADKHLLRTCGLDLSPSSPHLRVVGRTPAGTVTHIFSHIVWTMHVERVRVVGDVAQLGKVVRGKRGAAGCQWVPWREMGAKGLPTAVKKVWKVMGS